MLINKWNSIIDSSPCDMEGANILTPTEKRENYDFIWVLLWPSVEARDECWNDWSDNHSSDWDKTIDGIMSHTIQQMLLCSKRNQEDLQKKKIRQALLLTRFIFVNLMMEVMKVHWLNIEMI